MQRRLIYGVTILAAVFIVGVNHPSANESAQSPVFATVLDRFLALGKGDDPIRYRALRHMEAKCEHFASAAAMDVWTEVDARGTMRYQIVNESGSDYIRSKVFRGVLEGEQKAVNSGEPDKVGITQENYAFDHIGNDSGLVAVAIKPRRKDMLLVDGSILLRPEDGELVRIEGRLSKMPSFWVRRVEIIRHYKRLNGISMPVSLESVANLLLAGRSTFRMTYDYETISGRRVGNPQPKMVASIEP